MKIQNNIFEVCMEAGVQNLLLQGSTCSYPQYGEQPFATMDVNFRTPTGQVLSGKGTITVNAETGSWSYIVGFEDTKAENICFFLSGNNFGPYTGNAQKTNKQDNPAMPKDGEMPGVTKRATNLSN